MENSKPQKEVIEMNTLSMPLTKETVDAQNAIAAVLTIVPGLGHIYKGHLAAGLVWMFFGIPLAIWIGILLGLATAGVGLLFPILCWVALAFDAYNEKNRRSHHLLPPTLRSWSNDDEMQD
jgi:hypothetical protein